MIILSLLRDLRVVGPKPVWCVDITYLPLPSGFVYRVAVSNEWLCRKGA
jgi:hypothetical protein